MLKDGWMEDKDKDIELDDDNDGVDENAEEYNEIQESSAAAGWLLIA